MAGRRDCEGTRVSFAQKGDCYPGIVMSVDISSHADSLQNPLAVRNCGGVPFIQIIGSQDCEVKVEEFTS